MSKYIFVFDLDSVLTKAEILPALAKNIGCAEQMNYLTEQSMMGSIDFNKSFLSRVNMLKDMPLGAVHDIILKLPLQDKLIDFLSEAHGRCYIITGNLDVWIEPLMQKINMSKYYFSSKASIVDGKIANIIPIADKSEIMKKLPSPRVAIGDGSNDTDMVKDAEIGIGFGAVRSIAPSVVEVADYVFYDEDELYNYLRTLL